jgi:alanine racemase
LKLNYSIATCSECFDTQASGEIHAVVTHVITDSRKIIAPEGGLFFALQGTTRSGNDFVVDAYKKGVRMFVVGVDFKNSTYTDAVFWKVESPLHALQQLATFHRKQFTYPVIAITGSVGKTTFKEWAFHCLSPYMSVVRSPKSFNSQIGVALSLLELHASASIALIEAGISENGEMAVLEQMIQPTIGVFTAFGKAHEQNFGTKEHHFSEKIKLFSNCAEVFVSQQISFLGYSLPNNFTCCTPTNEHQFSAGFNELLGVLSALLTHFNIPKSSHAELFARLPKLALRMEIIDGVNNNIIINDTYNLDKDALQEALHYQLQLAGKKSCIVIIGLAENNPDLISELAAIIAPFQPFKTLFIQANEHIPWNDFSDAVILVKAHRNRNFEQEVAKGKALKHRTSVTVNLSAIKHNTEYYRKHLPASVKLLCMVKADAYGAGASVVAPYLAQLGIDYFGVAFADEGVQLKQLGIEKPIIVMNPDPEHAELIIAHQLEPAIYSFAQLDEFIRVLIQQGKTAYPIHLKFDTGMHRLGFSPADKEQLLSIINTQPEITIKGIYSHLADADNAQASAYTHKQIELFEAIISFFRDNLNTAFCAHLLNSEGALRYPTAAFDMVRIGISLYGFTENQQLKNELTPAISWSSAVSQVKSIQSGDFIGYGCSFQAKEDMTIAIIPVGYADGFRRNLSNGVGHVIINEHTCAVVGRVCMDMIMVAVPPNTIKEGDFVEIIGAVQSMEQFAASMQTIPYEVMTGLSKRMQRIYVED